MCACVNEGPNLNVFWTTFPLNVTKVVGSGASWYEILFAPPTSTYSTFLTTARPAKALILDSILYSLSSTTLPCGFCQGMSTLTAREGKQVRASED